MTVKGLPYYQGPFQYVTQAQAINRAISKHLISLGTLNSSLVHPREVFRIAIMDCAASLILSHNHPSGDPAPSPDDMAITRKLVQACRLMGITVHEHLIIGREGYFSFADHGHMARLNTTDNSL